MKRPIGHIRWQSPLFWLYILLLAGGVRAGFFYLNLTSPLQLAQEESFFFVESGQSLSHIAQRLENDGVIRNAFDLRVYARLSGVADSIHAGEYRLSEELTPLDLLDRLVSGRVVSHQVRLLEGWTVRQALAAIQAHDRITPTPDLTDPDAVAAALGLERHPEGLLFPDTYNFTAGSRDVDILRRAHQRMQTVLEETWPLRAVGLPYDTPYEALIMASIVEKETGLAGERDRIAGVFVRRLQRNMRLQTDPTVIYGLGTEFDGNLTRDDLRRPTPYNTYTRHGLPPTPIALPGRAAIMASLNPAPGDALYFVARGDGSHVFSATLEEHNAAVRQYQIENRPDAYRSSPDGTEEP